MSNEKNRNIDVALDKKSDSYNTRKIMIMYGIALSFIALSLIVSYFVMSFALGGNSDDSTVINYAGRQRMLSQKISKALLHTAIAKDLKTIQGVTKELDKSLADWKQAHNGLQFGDSKLGIMPKQLSNEITTLFTQISPSHKIMVENLDQLLAKMKNPKSTYEELNGFANQIAPIVLKNEKIFLPLMDKITFQFNSESLAKIEVLKKIEVGILLLGITLLALEFVIVFTPTLRKLNNTLQELVGVNNQLVESKKNITESIYYAENIQNAILPDSSIIKSSTKDNFVFWQPKDIVGGDIYWAKEVEDGYLVALIDCTGHGVPGALMTMTAVSALNNIVTTAKDYRPSNLLREMNKAVRSTLGKNKKAQEKLEKKASDREGSDDGMDVGICYIIPSKNKVIYAGSKLIVYRWKNGEVEQVKGDKQSIGYADSAEDFKYEDFEIVPEANEKLYISSDGYIDQKGGEKSRTMGKKTLADLIAKHHDLPMAEQKEKFIEFFNTYKGNEEQRDDVTVIGLNLDELSSNTKKGEKKDSELSKV